MNEPTAFQKALSDLADKRARFLLRHRERFLKAWMAATGVDPREAVLVEETAWVTTEAGGQAVQVRAWVEPRKQT